MSQQRTWTSAQESAMRTHGRTLLISAAAGSGKTATLTERIIRRITDADHPAELSRMLIVTFTRAAAAELKQRISDAISEKIAQNPTNRHLQRQLLSLGSAHIHTIDAFCYQPVKENFAEIGMPASFRIADDAELLPLSERMMGELIDEFYQRYATHENQQGMFALLESNPFADLCDSLTPSKDDSVLTVSLHALYHKLLNFPEELSRLKMQGDLLATQAQGDFLASAHGSVIKEWMLLFCDSSIRFFENALDTISVSPAATKAYYNGFDSELTFLKALKVKLTSGTYRDVQAHLQSHELGKLSSLKDAEPVYVALKDEKNAIVKVIRSFRDDYFNLPAAEISLQMRHLSRMCFILHDFLVAYDIRMEEEKNKRGICTFTDNRRKLLKMLMDPNGDPSPLCQSYLEKFDEVYIDEYQDVDEVQDTIFRLIGGDHRFMVGDIKQSIYGFRGADPSVFAGYRSHLTPLASGDDPKGNSIFMSNNFRCDESVIRVTNAVCSHIFSACPDSIGYVPEDDLEFSKKKPFDGYSSPPVHIALIDPLSPKEKRELGREHTHSESVYVANQIAELLRSGATKADGNPIQPQDIAILSKTTTAFGEYMTALTNMGIPTGCAELEKVRATRDVLHGPDMMYLINLLRVINNPDNDLPLSEILRGDFPAMSLDEVITLRGMGESHGSLFSAIEACAVTDDDQSPLQKKACDFLSWLSAYRAVSTSLSAERLLRMLRRDDRVMCRQTKAFAFLYENARSCRVAPFVGLYTFLSYIENKLLTSKNAPADQESNLPGGSVKLMSIHKSKGLEFPVCFVVGCGNDFLQLELKNDLLFNKTTGIAIKHYDRHTQRKFNTLLRQATALAIKTQSCEDEMRVLYVAMTRARERLYLTGINRKDRSFPAGDRYGALTGGCYHAWIKAGLEVHPEIKPFYELHTVLEADITPDVPLTPLQITAPAVQDNAHADYYRGILARVAAPTVMQNKLRAVPTKVPASRMSARLLDECVFVTTDIGVRDDDKPLPSEYEGTLCHVETIENIKRSVSLMSHSSDNNELELLLKENKRPTAAEKGTATHLFLQYCRWPNVISEGLEEEISRLAEEGFISPRVAKILDRKQLTRFFESEFIKRAMSASKVERELKFQRLIPLRTLTKDTAFAEALGDRTLFVQGSVDLLCHYDDGHIELCDYKTDRLTDEELADPSLLALRMKERHGNQLLQYAAAIEERYGQRPSRIFIFSLPLGEAVEIDV